MKLLPRYVPKQNRTTEMLEEMAMRLQTTTAAVVESIEAGRAYFVHSPNGGRASRLLALGEIHGMIDQAYAAGADVASIEILDLSDVPAKLRRAAQAALN